MFFTLLMEFTFFKSWRSAISLCVGSFFFILSFLCLVFHSEISQHVKHQIDKELTLAEGSFRLKYWEQTPVPLYLDVYFFNWTNPPSSNWVGGKPEFTEVGPYRFLEVRSKTNLKWNSNGTLTFKQARRWYFDEDFSQGRLSDVITTMDPITLSVIAHIKPKDYVTRVASSYIFSVSNRKLYTRKTVIELFSGYNDPYLSVIAAAYPFLENESLDYKFGLFYNRNGTSDHEGVFNIDTGEKNIHNVGKTLLWNNKNTTGFFDGQCGKVDGYTGEAFSPGSVTKAKRLALFSADLCRAVYLDYKEESSNFLVNSLKYTGGRGIVDSGQLDPSNKCFCVDECPPVGVYNMKTCKKGSPTFFSYPHFYLGDESLRENIGGMSPNPDLHEFAIDVEPTYGLPTSVKARFQVNMKVSPDENIRLVSDLNSTLYLPLFWANLHASLTPSTAFQILVVVNHQLIITSMIWSFLIGSLVLICLPILRR